MMVDILSMIIEWLPSVVKSRLIPKEEKKQKHLADIKREVFDPMLKILDDTHIPMLEGRMAIIEAISKPVFVNGVDATKYSGKIERELRVTSPDSESEWNPNFTPPEINSNLYLDMKENHFKEFATNYEEFKFEFNNYCNKWLEYAIEIQNITQRELDIPPFEDLSKESFVYPQALAVYIIGRIMRINPSQLFISDNPWNSISVQGSGLGHGFPIVLKGTRENVQKCIELVNRLMENDKKYGGVYPEQRSLLERANNLRSELDKIIKTYKLPGDCDYV